MNHRFKYSHELGVGELVMAMLRLLLRIMLLLWLLLLLWMLRRRRRGNGHMQCRVVHGFRLFIFLRLRYFGWRCRDEGLKGPFVVSVVDSPGLDVEFNRRDLAALAIGLDQIVMSLRRRRLLLLQLLRRGVHLQHHHHRRRLLLLLLLLLLRLRLLRLLPLRLMKAARELHRRGVVDKTPCFTLYFFVVLPASSSEESKSSTRCSRIS